MKQLNWYQIFGSSNVPDGKTVEPTDDIQIWLHCADIWDKSYTLLIEVLEDTDTLALLMASKNAVDYLVRSTTWTAGKALVPVLTGSDSRVGSNMNPGSSYAPWRVFDGNTNDSGWFPNGTGVKWVSFNFGTPTVAAKSQCSWYGPYLSRVSSAKIQAFNGVEWIDVTDDFISTPGSKINFKNIGAYEMYRGAFNCTNSNGFWLMEMQFYSIGITDDSNAMALIGANNYASNALLADPTWCEAIVESEYWESVLNVKVPVMTSNTTPSGECYANSVYSSTYAAWKAFDGNDSTSWGDTGSGSGTVGHYIYYKFPSAYIIYHALVNQGDGITNKIQGSNDGSTWEDIATYVSVSGVNNVNMSNNDTAYLYYRVYCHANPTTHGYGASTIQFYGRKDV